MLNLSSNRVQDLLELEHVQLPSLTSACFTSNAVCRKRLYRPMLLMTFPALCTIDGRAVAEEDRAKAASLLAEREALGEGTTVGLCVDDLDVNAAVVNRVPLKVSSLRFDGGSVFGM